MKYFLLLSLHPTTFFQNYLESSPSVVVFFFRLYKQLGYLTSSSYELPLCPCSQGEKAIEDIKSRVLILTGRSNLSSSNANQVQRQRLTMFSPTCESHELIPWLIHAFLRDNCAKSNFKVSLPHEQVRRRGTPTRTPGRIRSPWTCTSS